MGKPDHSIEQILPDGMHRDEPGVIRRRPPGSHYYDVIGEQLMEVGALHYTTDDLYRAFHTNELKRRDETFVTLDYRQCGLGGASCGPMTRPEYLIQPGSYQLNFRLRPIL